MVRSKNKHIATPSLFAEKPPEPIYQEVPELIPAPVVEEEKKMPAPAPEKKKIDPTTSVKQRNGEVLSVGDEVTIDAGILTGLLKETHKEGQVFVIEKMTPWLYCESQMLVIAARKDDREKKTVGVAGKGIDTNWFKKI